MNEHSGRSLSSAGPVSETTGVAQPGAKDAEPHWREISKERRGSTRAWIVLRRGDVRARRLAGVGLWLVWLTACGGGASGELGPEATGAGGGAGAGAAAGSTNGAAAGSTNGAGSAGEAGSSASGGQTAAGSGGATSQGGTAGAAGAAGGAGGGADCILGSCSCASWCARANEAGCLGVPLADCRNHCAQSFGSLCLPAKDAFYTCLLEQGAVCGTDVEACRAAWDHYVELGCMGSP